MKRRDIIKSLTLLPLAGGVLANIFPMEPVLAHPVPKKARVRRSLIDELGIRTFINAAGTYTTMSASLMHDEVMDAIDFSAKEFCMLNEVQDKVGAAIAKLVHSETAMVTAGAFSALTLGMAGILTGEDKEKVKLLPHVQEGGMKSEVIIQKAHFDGYEHALANTGISLIAVETADDVDKAVNEKTASMHFLNCNTLEGNIKQEEWLQLAKKHHLPASIDIAADVPPVSNLWKFNDMGFDYVALSGGKAICGPQSAGVLMGKRNIIAAARLNDSPNGVTIGRGMKVNKEEMLGMYVALDRYIKQDHDKEWKMWEDRVAVITNAVKNIKGVTTDVSVPPIANHTPKVNIAWDTNKIKITPEELGNRLRMGSPSIEVISWGNSYNSIDLTVFMLKPGQDKIVANRIKEELLKVAA